MSGEARSKIGRSAAGCTSGSVGKYLFYVAYQSTDEPFTNKNAKITSRAIFLTNLKVYFNAIHRLRHAKFMIVVKRLRRSPIETPFEREVCLSEIEIQIKITYSGMVLAAEATLSLDSFFFIALEAIFA